MEIDRRNWMSPALLIQALVLVVGGLTVYWSTISEIRSALAESKASRAEMSARVNRLEGASDTCALSKFKSDAQEKDIDELHKQLREMDHRLQEHDAVTRKALPLGRRSELQPFQVN